MALIYNIEYNHTAKIGKTKEVKFRPWTTKNEKDYLIATESDKEISELKLFEILIKPCIEDKTIKLTRHEEKLLMIEIRKKSIGPDFEVRYRCSSCNNINELNVPFEKIISYKESNFQPIKVDDMIFNFSNEISENLKIKIDNTENKIEKTFIEFLSHISSIEINGELEDVFSFSELTEFIENIPSKIFDEVLKKFKEMKGLLKFELETFCIMCNKENNIDFSEGLPGFFWE